jgi:hypothetical protein
VTTKHGALGLSAAVEGDIHPFVWHEMASARIVRPGRQSSNPLPGPSLAIKLSEGSMRRLAELTARITPARSGPLARP